LRLDCDGGTIKRGVLYLHERWSALYYWLMKKANPSMAVIGQDLRPALPPGTLALAAKIDFPALYKRGIEIWEECATNLEKAFKFYKTDSEAIAAAAKIWGDEKAKASARSIKNTALRVMRELAERINAKTPNKILKDLGLRADERQAAGTLVKMGPKRRAETGADSMSTASIVLLNRNLSASASYQKITQSRLNPWTALTFILQHDATELARDLTFDEAEILRTKTIQIAEWMDAFLQALPKIPRGRVPQSRAQISMREHHGLTPRARTPGSTPRARARRG
jgi:hypothetical protein